jgi:hypothetical protein
VTIVEPHGALSPHDIWSLMAASEDWFPSSMDPRTPMALAITGDWVLKANLARRRCNPALAALHVMWMTRLTMRLGVWHPAKTWFLLADRRRYVPCSATPRLRILSELGWLARRPARIRAAALAVRAARAGVHLDFSNGNFGAEPCGSRVYYVDDEVYRLPWHSREDFRARVDRLTRTPLVHTPAPP